MSTYPSPIQNLIKHFASLPGIGPKAAERLTFHLLDNNLTDFVADFTDVKDKIKLCQTCFNFANSNTCELCADTKRDSSLLALVAKPQDVEVLERAHSYKGKYFVLGGLLSPLDGITPEDIRIKDLESRLKNENKIQEIILAFDNNVEGESTAIYLAKLLKPLNVRVTRLARGLSVGSDLEYADDVTLKDAIEHRWEV